MYKIKLLFFIIFYVSSSVIFYGYANDNIKRVPAYSKKFKIKKKRIIVPKARSIIRKIKLKTIRIAEPPVKFRKYFEAGTDEAELEHIINQEIKQLFNLLKTSKRRDLRLRLGSLYIEKARLIEYRLHENYNQKIILFKQKKIKNKPRLSLQPTYVYINKAIKLFETYRLQFPKDKNTDQVLFFLGVSYFKKGKLTKGRTRYEALIKKFPKSAYTYDVHFELGEYYFYKSKWKSAKKYYKKIARYRHKRLYSFALYKLAWCNFKLGKVDLALTYLETIIRVGLQYKNQQNIGIKAAAGNLHFAKEALNDLVLFYSQSKTKKTILAWSYFQEISGNSERAFKMLKSLAYFYLDQGYLKGIRFTFKQLIAEKPFSPKAYQYQYQIIRAYTYSGKRKIFLQELKNFIVKYGPSSEWAKENSGKPEVKKSINLIEKTIRNYAFRMHKSYRKTKGRIVRMQALYSYELYYNQFTKFKKANEMIFFYAELLFDLKKYTQSAKKYLYLVDNFPKSKYYEIASLNSVLTLEKTLPSIKSIQKFIGKRTDFVAFTKPIHEFQKIAFNYVSRFSKKSNVDVILYKMAFFHYEFNHHKQALEKFWHIINTYPNSIYSVYSANLILDIYNLKKDFIGLKKVAKELLKNKKIARSSSSKEIRKILSQISLKSAETSAKNKEYLKSAHLYQTFADTHPKSPLRYISYYNAALNFQKSGDFLKAISIYKVVEHYFSKKNINKKIKKNILKQLPHLYESTGQYIKAAQAFYFYSRSFPRDKKGINFIFNAAIIYDGFNYYSKAEEAYLKYLKKSKRSDKTQVFYLLAELKKRMGNSQKALFYYNQFLNRGFKNKEALVEASFKIAKIYEARGRKAKAKKWYNKTINIYNKNKKGVFYAAESKFNLVHNIYLKFIKIRMSKNQKKQSKIFQKKIQSFNSLKEDLKHVIGFNSGYHVVSTLVLIGLASEHIASFIYNSYVPKGLNKSEIQKYKEGLKQAAIPFKTEAIKNYKLAISKSREFSAYNQKWLEKATQRLSYLKQDKTFISVNPLLKKTILPVTLYDWSGM